MLHQVLIIATLFAAIVKSDPDCAYVQDPAWIDSNYEYQQKNGPIPLYFCTTEARYDNVTETTNYTSEMFLCGPWGDLYHFAFESMNCNSTESMPIISEIYSNSGYQCDSDNACSVFNVRSNVVGDTCQESLEEYDEFLVIADYCYVERDTDEEGNVNWRSIMATCDGTTAEYSVYDGVIDCSGDPGDRSISATSGDCADVPNSDGYEERYITLLNCGSTTPQEASIYSDVIDSSGCSYIVNGSFVYEEYYEYWDNSSSSIRNETRVERSTLDLPAPLGFDTCTKKYDNTSGLYGSQLAFCSDVLQLGFYAIWADRDVPSRCDGTPDVVLTFIDYDEFSCNVPAGSCDNFLLRTSDFEGDVCGYGEQYNEIRIVPNKCWSDDDIYLLAKCGSDTGSSVMNIAQYNVHTTADCSDASVFSLDLEDGHCYDMENDPPVEQMGPGSFSNFQILECMDYVAPGEEIPDCKFIQNPRWLETDYSRYCDDGWGNWSPCESERTDNQEFTVPVGVCMTDADEEGAESKMYLCTPWGTGVVLVYDGDECNSEDSTFMYAAPVNGYVNCDSSNYCDSLASTQMEVSSNEAGAGCMENSTNFDENAFIRGCTNYGIGSTYVDCSSTTLDVEYSVFPRPGCQGNSTMGFEIDRDEGDCADFGDEQRYVETEFCGVITPTEPEGCSYIVNPTWYQEETNVTRTREGAMPLSSDLCMIELDGDELVSYMYFCDERSNEAFIAWWNGTAGCQANGEPTGVARMWSAVDRYQCTGDNGEQCQFGFVTTANLDISDECELPADIEQSARLINTCWSSDDDGDVSSWMVECAGDELRVRLYSGDDCDDENIVNTVEVASNECVEEFIPGETDSQTYFVVNYCTEDQFPTTDPTPNPTSNPTSDPTMVLATEFDGTPDNMSDSNIINIFISLLFITFIVVLS